MSKISESELEVMRAIWRKGEMTFSEIVEEVSKSNAWSKSTIKTLIYRLVDKDILNVDKGQDVFKYSTKISEDDYKNSENQNFLQRLYNGSINDMLLAYTKSHNLTKKEIKELLNLIDSEENND